MSNGFPSIIDCIENRIELTFIKRDGITKCLYKGLEIFTISEEPNFDMLCFNGKVVKHIPDVGTCNIRIDRNIVENNFPKFFNTTIKQSMAIIKSLSERYPRILIETERRVPRQITIACLIGVETMKYIILDYPFKVNKYDNMKNKISLLLREYYSLACGNTFMFGKITGYVYYLSKDVGYEYDVNGNEIGLVSKEDPYACGSVQVC